MKRKLLTGGVFGALFILLLFPGIVSKGAADGLMLWFQVVLPSLLPFMVLSNVMLRLDVTASVGKLLYPVLHRVLHVSKEGSYAVTMGWISGYPLGAKVTADLCKKGRLDRREGQYLLTFCNNASPIFVLEYIAVFCLHRKMPVLFLFGIYGAAVLNAWLWYYLTVHRSPQRAVSSGACLEVFAPDCLSTTVECREYAAPSGKKAYPAGKKNDVAAGFFSWGNGFAGVMQALDDGILDAFITLTKIGGYIILFAILAELAEKMLPVSEYSKGILLGVLEITTGGEFLKRLTLAGDGKLLLGIMLTAFGGFSSVAQTASVLQGSRLSTVRYILGKCTHAVIAGGLAVLWILVKSIIN